MRFSTPAALAKALTDKVGLSTGYASDLAHAKRAPSLKVAVEIERKMRIPPRWWIERMEGERELAAA
jgi:hypothetical protein